MAKLGILTHFGSFQPGYALHVGWLERARLLAYVGEDFDFLVNETTPEGLYPNQKNVLRSPSTTRPKQFDPRAFDRRVTHYRKLYREVLEPYEVILTGDLIYQSKGDFLAWNQAMRHAQEDFRVRGLGKWWLHWVHSAWTAHRPNAKYPENLRYEPMPNSNIVYMNGAERQGIASQYGVDPDDIGVVYNPKDFRSFHNFTSLAWDITRKLSIPTKDIVQIFPFCSTRMKAKGIDDVIRTHAAIKRQGKSVALVLANSNSNGMHNFIDMKKAQAKELGLVEGDDFLFTSDITGKEALPRETVANLFLASNVFVFGSWREVCPNVVLEAKISGNLLAINAGLSCAHEFGGDEAIYFSGTAKRPGVPDGGAADRIETATDYDDLARKIIAKAPDQTAKWEYSYERIWNDQFLPLLVHAIRCARESAVEYKSGHGVRGTL